MKNKKNTVIVLSVLSICLVLSALATTTYALFSYDAYGANPEAYATGLLSITAKSKSDTISLTNAIPITDEEGLQTAPYVFTIKNVGNLDYEFDVMLRSIGDGDTTFPANYIKLQIDDGEVTTLANLTGGKLNTDKITLLAGESIDISIRVWLSENTTNECLGKSFESKIVTDGQAIYTSSNNVASVNLIEHINSLYANNKDATPVTNNGISYNYASSVLLMNDRLGTMNVGADAGNIRYYGLNPNNYIDIGDVYTVDTTINNFEKNSLFLSLFGISDSASCYEFFDCSTNYAAIGEVMGLTYTDETSCTAGLNDVYRMSSVDEMCGITEKKAGDAKLYRIIGLFKDVEKEDGTIEDLVKVIREDSIGEYAWDLTSDTSGYNMSNDWSNSTLKSILNNEYYNASSSFTHLYFDAVLGDVTSVAGDLSKKGLNSSVQSVIESVKWNLGGWNDSSVYSNQMYSYERGDAKCEECTYETIWPGKIALMYPSDYGYATDFTNCSNTLISYYENSACYINDWLFSLSNGNAIEWLLTPYSDFSGNAWYVGTGYVNSYYDGVVVNGFGVRPVFYLNSELSIEAGNGSEATPYVVR